MGRIFAVILLITILGLGGFFIYQNMTKKGQVAPQPTSSMIPTPNTEQTSPIFGLLSAWVPDATWDAPKKTTRETPYGNLSGLKVSGRMTDVTKSFDNFGTEKTMASLAYKKDIAFSADGPGASNWGYIKTEGGQKQVAVFGYSTNRIFGPESTSPPFTNLSVFVSDPFTPQ